ncbi:MAG: tetrapyrrole methylase [Neisseriaceae bacterium]|nr:MAG: tetrapyrrole methylase [Neisseriaceae bacterium]
MEDHILYLIPSPLSDNCRLCLLPEDIELVKRLDYFVVENAKTARKHLKILGMEKSLRDLEMMVLDKNTILDKITFANFLHQGGRIGMMSEAGCPAIADPGAWLVRLAHEMNFQVVPLVGPSSILLALMGSGANGQRFVFRGYLPIDHHERELSIKEMLHRIKDFNETQLFIETPYRNQSLFEFLIEHLPDNVMMTLAINLTDYELENIQSRSIQDWKKVKLFPNISRQPCVFVLG